jgi:hypothetical protein
MYPIGKLLNVVAVEARKLPVNLIMTSDVVVNVIVTEGPTVVKSTNEVDVVVSGSPIEL